MRIAWSDKAQKDLAEIVDFISLDSPARAIAFAKRLRSRAGWLLKFPLSGRIVPELRDEPVPPRELLIGNYRLL